MMQKKAIVEKPLQQKINTKIEQKPSTTSKLPAKVLPAQTNIKKDSIKTQPPNKSPQTAPIAVQNKVEQAKKSEEIIDVQTPSIEIVKIQIKKSSQLQKYQKDIESISKIKAQKIKLILETNFERDEDLLAFSIMIVKVANKVNYLKWRVKGMFTDDGQAKTIGDIISRFAQAYSIDLHLDNTFFADRGANSLAIGLKKLQNLSILQIELNSQGGKIAKKITQKGLEKIDSAISSLKNLQLIDFNYLNWDNIIKPKNLSNYVFITIVGYDGDESISQPQKIYQKFISSIEPMKDKLVSLKIQSYDSGIGDIDGCCCCTYEDNRIEYNTYLNLFPKILKYCFDLPYLTEFSQEFNYLEEENDYPNSKKAEIEIVFYEGLLQNLLNERYNQFQQIFAFNNSIRGFLSINPTMILTDLYIN